MALSHRSPNTEELDLYHNVSQDAYRCLNLSTSDTPQNVTRVIDDTLSSMIRGFGPLFAPEDRPDTLFGCLFGEQFVREFAWEWIQVVDADADVTNESAAVASPNRALVIYPFQAVKDCLEGNTSVKFALAFNMVKQPSEIPAYSADSFADVMRGVHHVFPPRVPALANRDAESFAPESPGLVAPCAISSEFVTQNGLLLNCGEAQLLHNEFRSIVYGAFSRKRFSDFEHFVLFAQTIRGIADGWYNAFNVESLDVGAMVDQLDPSTRIQSPEDWLGSAKNFSGSLRDWASHYAIDVNPSDIPRHITGELYWVGDSLDFEMIADCPKYFAQVFVSWY